MKAIKSLATAAVAAALGAFAFALTPAVGQEPGSALRGHDTDAPVDVAAERIEVQDRVDRAIFSGNVLVRQGQLQLNAERITIAYSSAGGIAIERIDASGGVFMRSPSETAQGQYAIYDIDQRLLTLVGGVTLTRGESRVSGGRLVLDLDTGRAVMDGAGPPAPDMPAGTTTTPGRVTGRFTVPRRGSPDTQ
jgi:lipopolysaccharide export system protein LptA